MHHQPMIKIPGVPDDYAPLSFPRSHANFTDGRNRPDFKGLRDRPSAADNTWHKDCFNQFPSALSQISSP